MAIPSEAPRAGPANIIGLRSKAFVAWVDENLRKPFQSGPGKLLMDGVVDKFLNWAKRNSTWPLHFGIMCCAIEMAATSDPRFDVERLGIIYRSSPRQVDVLLLNGPISLKLRRTAGRSFREMGPFSRSTSTWRGEER